MSYSVDSSKHFIPLSELKRQKRKITLFDYHCHTNGSPDSETTPKQLFCAAKENGLDGVAASDHDMISSKELMHEASQSEVLSVPSVELTTIYWDGISIYLAHIILLNAQPLELKKLFKSWWRPSFPTPQFVRNILYVSSAYFRAPHIETVIQWLKSHPHVLAIVAHPLVKKHRSIWDMINTDDWTSLPMGAIPQFLPHIQGIEIMNGSYCGDEDRERLAFAEKYRLIPFGGSDAHEPKDIGRVATYVDGTYRTADALIHALRTKPTGTTYRDSKI